MADHIFVNETMGQFAPETFDHCPNSSGPDRSGQTVRCSLLPANIRINRRVCGECRQHWTDDVPPSTPTPPLREIAGPEAQRRSRGLGDTIASLTSAIGIKSCGGCERRRQRINEIFPYR